MCFCHNYTYIFPGSEAECSVANDLVTIPDTPVIIDITTTVCRRRIFIVPNSIWIEAYPVCGIIHSTALELGRRERGERREKIRVEDRGERREEGRGERGGEGRGGERRGGAEGEVEEERGGE